MEKISPNTNALNWFEIPVNDTGRARKFYETILDITMETQVMMGMDMTFFPYDPQSQKVSGALVKSDMHKTGTDGAVIYLNANPDLQLVQDRIEAAGGKILMPKMHISDEVGYMAFFMDTEGNRVALHSGN